MTEQSREHAEGGVSRRGLLKGAAAGAAVMAAGGIPAKAEAAIGSVHTNERVREPQDIALVNGKIYTLDDKNTVVDKLTIRAGRITALGEKADVGAALHTIDLGGAAAIPGLVAGHEHFVRMSLNPGYEVRNIESAGSVHELQQLISDAVTAQSIPSGAWITCINGWNRNGLTEKRLPTAAELDAAAPNNPVYLVETGGGGQGVTNAKGVSFFQSRNVSVDASTGVLLQASQGTAQVASLMTNADALRGAQTAQAFAASKGLTTIHDAGNAGTAPRAYDPSNTLSPYQFMFSLWQYKQNKVRMRPYMFTGDDPTTGRLIQRIQNTWQGLGDDHWKIAGLGELLIASSPNPSDYVAAYSLAAAGNWHVMQHSLTLSDNQVHIAALQQIQKLYPTIITDQRWVLAHVNVITPDLINAAKALGLGMAIQGYQYTGAQGLNPSGPPTKDLLNAGFKIGMGTDSTNVSPFTPWLQMSYIVTGANNAGQVINPGQQVSRLDVLKMYTSGSAWKLKEETKMGSLGPGKFADIAVLTGDPLKVSDDQFRLLRSQLTILDGHVVHQSDRFAKLKV